MALEIRAGRPSALRTLWHSTIGKKVAMATTGVIMIGFVVLHMVGNLKVFTGAAHFNAYSHWLRTIGEPALPHEGFLWIMRVVLLASVAIHITAAVQLTHRSHQPHRKFKRGVLGRNYVTFTMRSGGVILALFIVWHILDLTALVVNARGQAGHPYQNLVAGFSLWYPNVIYLVALVAVGFHLWHGIWSAATTLGVRPGRHRAVRWFAAALSIVVTVGFAAVPVAVMTGVVS